MVNIQFAGTELYRYVIQINRAHFNSQGKHQRAFALIGIASTFDSGKFLKSKRDGIRVYHCNVDRFCNNQHSIGRVCRGFSASLHLLPTDKMTHFHICVFAQIDVHAGKQTPAIEQ
jgi:hypothetical protein